MNNTSKKTNAGRPNYSARKALPPNDIAAGSAMPPGSLPFTAVVQLTTESDARKKAKEEAMKRDELRTRSELSGTYLPRFRPMNRETRYEEEEDDTGPYVPQFVRGKDADDDGFTEVKKKSRKTKRELTTSELNRKMMEPPSDEEEGEHNAELYENARQHEHP